MKFLVFGGGLGNQIFEYAYYLYLKKKYPKHRYYGFYKIRLKGHNGLEIDKRFEIELPKSNWFSNLCVYTLYTIKKISSELKIFDLEVYSFNENAILHNALKIDKKIIPDNKDWIRFRLKESDLNKQNKDVLIQIRTTNSCFVHVRRGDYVTGKWAYAYSGCCPLEYYQKALNDIKNKIHDVKFFCFSDDVEWMKTNLTLPDDSIFINWNTGDNSFIDMYLMAQCKNSIMANSTFSYWASMLGEQKKYVYYPSKWINGIKPDIFYNEWLTF